MSEARVLLVDNDDSFTWNLAQALMGLGAEVHVARAHDLSEEEARAYGPSHLVISPGPGHPRDAALSLQLLREWPGRVPILGVCLGHQALGHAYGATVTYAPEMKHGKSSRIRHDGRGLFAGLPEELEVGRYHSLVVVEETLPAQFVVTARSEDGVVMGIRHHKLAVEGVQFHPESVLTPLGDRLLANFLRMGP